MRLFLRISHLSFCWINRLSSIFHHFFQIQCISWHVFSKQYWMFSYYKPKKKLEMKIKNLPTIFTRFSIILIIIELIFKLLFLLNFLGVDLIFLDFFSSLFWISVDDYIVSGRLLFLWGLEEIAFGFHWQDLINF